MAKTVFIIAEAGVNHNGRIELARRLVDVAVEAEVDAVKFQTFKAENVISCFAEKAEYQKQTTDLEETQLEMARCLELNRDEHEKLMKYCISKNIEFLSTPFDLESIDLLVSLGLERIKIPSGEITNLPYLCHIGKYGKAIILSTGMASLEEIEAALVLLEKSGTSRANVTVMHCNTEYPTPMIDVNLKAMLSIRNSLGVEVGYSDHTLGIEVPVAAVALGATVIEKHFTLDRTLPGPDHRASLEPIELKAMVQSIRNVEKAMGDGIKRASPSELKNKPIARKSIVAAMDINKGVRITEENITVKRPGTGISPMLWGEVLGKVAIRDFKSDELIEL
ncbi:MAG: N-acetylneuraminate synthase [Candidatus Scalindua sp.]|jgi:N,N'-diacetyllegionaminate synthase|nr:N-acetylneuraminate synthase [Candidatus Scalindua sp.]MBT6231131.1 N-acetylneuraminate synthase [Candidatus Scalindua sp.]